MNNDTNNVNNTDNTSLNNVNISNTDGIKDDFKIDTSKFADVKKEEDIENKVEAVKSEVVQEEKTDTSDSEKEAEVVVEETVSEEVKQEEVKDEEVVSSETVIDADINQEIEEKEAVLVGTIEEVSVSVESDSLNNLSESEISENSVFNEKAVDVESSMKEGQTHEKKGFPFFMLFVFILMVVAAFFIDDIVVFIEEYRTEEKQPEKKEEKPTATPVEGVTLDSVYNSLKESKYIVEFETANNVEVNIIKEETKLILTVPNYIDKTVEGSTISAEFNYKDDILSVNTNIGNSSFALDMSIILVKEIAVLNEVGAGLDDFIKNNLYTNKIDNGFEFTNSEDGNNFYQIALNVKIKLSNDK